MLKHNGKAKDKKVAAAKFQGWLQTLGSDELVCAGESAENFAITAGIPQIQHLCSSMSLHLTLNGSGIISSKSRQPRLPHPIFQHRLKVSKYVGTSPPQHLHEQIGTLKPLSCWPGEHDYTSLILVQTLKDLPALASFKLGYLTPPSISGPAVKISGNSDMIRTLGENKN